jgi:hypothetical protein
MKLRSLDTISVSAVKSDSLRPGEEFDINDAAGADLLKTHPTKFERLDQPASEKAEPAPSNKAEGAAPANKASTQRKKKGG